MRALKAAFTNRDIARLEAAWAATAVGSWAFTILLAIYAYGKGGAGAVGIAALVRMLPSAMVAGYTAMLADRYSRRHVLIVSALLRAALVGGIGVATLGGASLAMALALAALFTAVGTAHKPAQAALFTKLARTPTELAAANIGWSVLDNGGFVAGSVLAGTLAGLAGTSIGFGACALPFLVAGVIVARMPGDEPEQDLPEQALGVGAEMLRGVRAVSAHPQLRVLFVVFAADIVVQGMVDVLLVVAALEVLEMGRPGVGWLSAAWGVGGLLGGAAATMLLVRGRLVAGITAGCVLAGLPLVATGALAVPGPALALLVVAGVGFGMAEVALLTLTQRLASCDVLGRVYGVQEGIYVIATALGSLAAAALARGLGGVGALIATGCILPLVALTLGRRLHALESDAPPVPEGTFRLVRGLPMFAPLPMATVESLALRTDTQRFAPGSTIVTQGADAADFYIVDEGTVEVRQDNVFRRREQKGECFGEIALVRDVPRTATVSAITPVTVLVLGRQDFLAAIGSHARSGGLVERVIADRLGDEAHANLPAGRSSSP